MKSKLAVLPAILKRLELMPYLKALQNIFSYPKKTENYRGQTAPTALRNSRHSTVEAVRFKWVIRILIFCVSGFYSFGI